jgi:hypothetical protein
METTEQHCRARGPSRGLCATSWSEGIIRLMLAGSNGPPKATSGARQCREVLQAPPRPRPLAGVLACPQPERGYDRAGAFGVPSASRMPPQGGVKGEAQPRLAALKGATVRGRPEQHCRTRGPSRGGDPSRSVITTRFGAVGFPSPSRMPPGRLRVEGTGWVRREVVATAVQRQPQTQPSQAFRR